MPDPLRHLGRSTPRIDARERVTGRAVYTGDVHLPDMLYARVLRSPHPHARIRSIDASRALAMNGVKAVLTHENCAGKATEYRRRGWGAVPGAF